MRLQKQLIQHAPHEGRWGDCWRTCIACLLDMDAADVPHFADKGANLDESGGAARKWLKDRGFNIITFCVFDNWLHVLDDWFDDTPYILTGMSPNFEGVCHCVIGKGACETLWDVAPSGKGISGPHVTDNGERCYWVEFIVPMQLKISEAA